MVINSAFGSGIMGVNRGLNQLDKTAHDIATVPVHSDGVNPGKLADSMVELITSEVQVKASVEVVQTASEVLGTIVDLKA